MENCQQTEKIPIKMSKMIKKIDLLTWCISQQTTQNIPMDDG